jgi:hypothetical protein
LKGGPPFPPFKPPYNKGDPPFYKGLFVIGQTNPSIKKVITSNLKVGSPFEVLKFKGGLKKGD